MNLTRAEADPATPFAAQLIDDISPLTILVRYHVEPEYREAFIGAWTEESHHMLSQPGCLHVQMYQGIAGSLTILEVATWESSAHLRAAVASEGYRRLLAEFPPCTSSPQILERLGVPAVCTGAPLRALATTGTI
jgi:quinol monooxygenase YgiN